MTTKAIQARAELKAWAEKYGVEVDANYDGCYYPDDTPTITFSVDKFVIAKTGGYDLSIQE